MGLSTFHPFTIPVGVQVNDRLCDSPILSVQNRFSRSFNPETPAVASRSLHSVPCLLLHGLSSPTPLSVKLIDFPTAEAENDSSFKAIRLPKMKFRTTSHNKGVGVAVLPPEHSYYIILKLNY